MPPPTFPTDLPPPLVVRDARPAIAGQLRRTGRRILVLDDDPTGSQTVHDVSVIMELDEAALADGLAGPGSTCFVLTNSRSLAPADAAALNLRAGAVGARLEARTGGHVDVVSRSDSTLRGHVMAEVTALQQARAAATGQGYAGVLLVPAYLEAGRCTAGDVHWARIRGELVAVGDTEFARDATFGYRSSDLKDFVAEVSGGVVPATAVRSISLEDIRTGGPDRVAEILATVTGGAFVVVNATEYSDLEVVVLGLRRAQDDGREFLYRSGPSFVRALAGLEPRPPLAAAEVRVAGERGGHGLVGVGSHVGLTTSQVARARQVGGLVEFELDVPTLADPATRDEHVATLSVAVTRALGHSDVLVCTSRTVVGGADGASSLALSRSVSAALVEVVRTARAAGPAWVIAKGGITSHDLAAKALEIRRAVVQGQLFPGIVSVLRPVEAPPEVVGVPFVVFAGNVGDEHTLAAAIRIMRGTPVVTGRPGAT